VEIGHPITHITVKEEYFFKTPLHSQQGKEGLGARINTCRPPCAYKCLCINSSIVGTLFPLASKESCIDSVETPKTFALRIVNKNISTFRE